MWLTSSSLNNISHSFLSSLFCVIIFSMTTAILSERCFSSRDQLRARTRKEVNFNKKRFSLNERQTILLIVERLRRGKNDKIIPPSTFKSLSLLLCVCFLIEMKVLRCFYNRCRNQSRRPVNNQQRSFEFSTVFITGQAVGQENMKVRDIKDYFP